MVNTAPPSQFVESGAVNSEQKKEKTEDEKMEEAILKEELPTNKKEKSVHFGE